MRRSTVNTGDSRSVETAIDLVRELIKLAIILVYAVFATVTLVTTQNPLVFAPILPWALWSSWRTGNPPLNLASRRDEDPIKVSGTSSDRV